MAEVCTARRHRRMRAPVRPVVGAREFPRRGRRVFIRRWMAAARGHPVPLAQRSRLEGFRRFPRRDGPQAPQEHPPGTAQGARDAGVIFRLVHGDGQDADLAAMHGFYLQTFSEYGNSPALTLGFVRHLARDAAATDHRAGRARWPAGRRRVVPATATPCMAATGAPPNCPACTSRTCWLPGHRRYCLREGLARFRPGAQGRAKIAPRLPAHIVRSPAPGSPTRVRPRHRHRPLVRRKPGDRRWATELTAHSPVSTPPVALPVHSCSGAGYLP